MHSGPARQRHERLHASRRRAAGRGERTGRVHERNSECEQHAQHDEQVLDIEVADERRAQLYRALVRLDVHVEARERARDAHGADVTWLRPHRDPARAPTAVSATPAGSAAANERPAASATLITACSTPGSANSRALAAA